MKFIRKYLRIILGVIALALGITFMFIPFIPLGYILLFVAVFFLATFFPPLKRFLDYLKEKDEKGTLDKVEKQIEELEQKIERAAENRKSG